MGLYLNHCKNNLLQYKDLEILFKVNISTIEYSQVSVYFTLFYTLPKPLELKDYR